MTTYTALIRWNIGDPNWKETVTELVDLVGLHLATFVDERFLWRREFLFEVMGSPEQVSWFRERIEAEDRKFKYIIYRHYNEGR